MDYEPKIIPEGINTSTEHPLREFFVLVSGIALVIVIVTAVLALSTDYLIQFIPLDKEHEWFSKELATDANSPEPDSDSNPAEHDE